MNSGQTKRWICFIVYSQRTGLVSIEPRSERWLGPCVTNASSKFKFWTSQAQFLPSWTPLALALLKYIFISDHDIKLLCCHCFNFRYLLIAGKNVCHNNVIEMFLKQNCLGQTGLNPLNQQMSFKELFASIIIVSIQTVTPYSFVE